MSITGAGTTKDTKEIKTATSVMRHSEFAHQGVGDSRDRA